MTKNSLLLAASAIAVLSAGTSAVAGQISGSGTFAGVNSTGTTTPYSLARELRFSATATTATAFANTQTNLTFNFLPTAVNGFPNGESLRLTLDVSGAVFTAPGSATIVTSTGAGCAVSVSGSTPPAANATTATFFVNFNSCTSTSTGLTITLPVQVTGANNVTAGALLENSFGGSLFPVDGGRSVATFISSTSAFSTTITTTSSVATADVASGTGPYRTFTGAIPTAATVTVTINTSTNESIGAPDPVDVADVTGIRLVANATTGSFAGYNLVAGHNATSATTSVAFTTDLSATTSSTVRTLTLGSATATSTVITVQVTDLTATGTATTVLTADAAIPASAITLTALVDLDTANSFGTSTGVYVDTSTATSAFNIINRNGANFIAPWVALGSTTNASAIRIGNNSTAATGPIRAVLLSDNGTINPTTATVTITQAMLQAGTLNAQGGVDAGDVITIRTTGALAAAFGGNGANGDVQISIEAVGSGLSAKVRQTQSTGQIFESSLGNLNSGS